MKLRNAKNFIQSFLKIRTKKGDIIALVLNPPQLRLYETIKALWEAGKPIRIIILKARQMGFSTLTAAIIFWLVVTNFNRTAMVVAHEEKATKTIFGMYRLFFTLLPDWLKPQTRANSGYVLEFNPPTKSKSQVAGLNSVIKCATAGGQGIGRSETVQFLHLSEYGFWPGNPKDTYLGVAQTVPDDPGTMIIIESTANGFNDFKDKWDLAVECQRTGEEGFVPIFFAWHEMPSYRRRVPQGFQRTEEEEELAALYGLDDEQLVWRRYTINTKCGGDVERFRQEYPSCPEEAFIASGSCVFDQAAIIARIEELRKAKAEPIKTGEYGITYGKSILDLRKWEWRDDPKGSIRIYREPEKGVPYVIGADTAGSDGKDKDSDFFAAHVLDNRTGAQVAVLHGKLGEREFTEQLYALGMVYNNALIGIETNYSTYPNELIQLMGYRRLYVQQHTDEFTKKIINKYGWDTNRTTRPLIIDGLKDVAKRSLHLIGDIPTLEEMLVFIKNASGRPEAEVGQHDDLVMSLAISHYIRGQQRVTAKPQGAKRKWTKAMREEYWEAEGAERREMERRWGRPDEEDEDDDE